MKKLFALLEEGVTAAHAVEFVKKDLLSAGFLELSLGDEWNLQENTGYYVNLYHTNAVAFKTGRMTGKKPVFRIAMAHSDYPNFQIKPEPMVKGKNVTKLNVEIYGGMYQKSWLDRPLGVAGRVIISGKNAFAPESLLYKSDLNLCIIPSLAIHMDFELNKKGALDTAKELVPLMSLCEQSDILAYIAKEMGIEKDKILDYDLYLYNMEEPVLVGIDQSMLAAPKLDNLTSVSAITESLGQTAPPDDTIDVMVIFDNEEVGSRSKQGADSELFPLILERICSSLHLEGFEKSDIMANGFLLSVDVAHAHHPNYEEKSDVTNKAYLGNGFCIKRSVGQKYGTTADTAAVLKTICDKEKIPYSIAINRTGISGGATLGPIVTAHLPMPCADIGMPVLSMHSAMELGAVADYHALKDFIKAYYAYRVSGCSL